MATTKRKLRDIGAYVIVLLAPAIWLYELLSSDDGPGVSRKRYRRLPTYRRRHERQRYIRDTRKAAFEYPSDSESLFDAILRRQIVWGLLLVWSVVLTLVLSVVMGVIEAAKPFGAVPLSLLVAVMFMTLPNYCAMLIKLGFLHYRAVDRVYERISANPEERIRRRDAVILFLARPSNIEGVVGIFFGLFGYVVGHYIVWGN